MVRTAGSRDDDPQRLGGGQPQSRVKVVDRGAGVRPGDAATRVARHPGIAVPIGILIGVPNLGRVINDRLRS